MKKFHLFWLDGKRETVQGKSIADAFQRAGYSQGALRALDFFLEEGNKSEYTWTGTEWLKKT
jgi:hypothetical protein